MVDTKYRLITRVRRTLAENIDIGDKVEVLIKIEKPNLSTITNTFNFDIED